MRTILGLVLAAALLAGCSGKKDGSDGDEKAEPIPFDQAPAEMVKEAQKRIPNVTFNSARKKPDGTYEIRGKDKTGKIREVEFHPDGKVSEE
jgi:hypothetical protein